MVLIFPVVILMHIYTVTVTQASACTLHDVVTMLCVHVHICIHDGGGFSRLICGIK